MNLEDIRKELGDDTLKLEENIGYVFTKLIERYAVKHFGTMPYLNQLTDARDKSYNGNLESDENPSRGYVYDDECDEEELRERREGIDVNKSLENVLKAYPDAILYGLSEGQLCDKAIFHDEFIFFGGIFYTTTLGLPEKIKECIVKKESEPKIRWVLMSKRGYIQTKYMTISPKGGIEDNYNDDFFPVDEKITELIHSDDSCIIILQGKPGTGKTSYIRNLINENKDVIFYWLDASMFNYIDSSEFIEYIVSCKNAVFVLEDSEDLLKSREEGRNAAMQSLLSISDGMLGDSLKLKFICTFNTDLKNIDTAITRKGRMKIKYEFKPLAKDKVEKIFEKKGIPVSEAKAMPLCDIYNYLDNNGQEETKESKIGFN